MTTNTNTAYTLADARDFVRRVDYTTMIESNMVGRLNPFERARNETFMRELIGAAGLSYFEDITELNYEAWYNYCPQLQRAIYEGAFSSGAEAFVVGREGVAIVDSLEAYIMDRWIERLDDPDVLEDLAGNILACLNSPYYSVDRDYVDDLIAEQREFESR